MTDVGTVLGLSPRLVAELLPFLDAPVAGELVARYREPQRHYHDVTHLREVLGHVANVAEQFGQLRVVAYAALYHDAVYDPRRKDNEARSAELARRDLAPLLQVYELEVVAELIMATAKHGAALDAAHPDTALFLDCDAAILGAEDTRYRQYAEAVRREYGHVSKLLYRLGRGKFLKAMLKRPRVFHTPWFEVRHGAQARRNLAAELDAL